MLKTLKKVSAIFLALALMMTMMAGTVMADDDTADLTNYIYSLDRTVEQTTDETTAELDYETVSGVDTYHVDSKEGITVDYATSMDMTELAATFLETIQKYNSSVTDAWDALETYYYWITDATYIDLVFSMDDWIELDEEGKYKYDFVSDMFVCSSYTVSEEDHTITFHCYWSSTLATSNIDDGLDPMIYLTVYDLPIASDWADEDGNDLSTITIVNDGSVSGMMYYAIIYNSITVKSGNESIDGGTETDTFILTTEHVKSSKPGSEKYILISGTDEEGNTTIEEVTSDSINAGDSVTFELKSNVPETLLLGDYVTWTYDEDTGEAVSSGSYILTFHDTIDSAFTIDYDSLTVTIGGVTLSSDNYTIVYSTSTDDDGNYIITDGCTFELSIDLIALYNAGQLTEDQISSAVDVVVTYNATLSDDATAGTYTNKSHVTYEGGTTPDSTVTEYVYGVKVYKYDSSETTTDEDGNTTYTKLIAGAGFTLYRTATTDEDGNVTYSDPVTTTDEDGETVQIFYTDENGYLCFDGLEAGTYYLKEVEVPDGYVASNAVITITLPEENATDYYVVCEVLNTPIPNTGGVGTTMFLIVGLALIVGAGTAYGVKNRRARA